MLAELMTGGEKRHAGEVLERQASGHQRAGEVSCREKKKKKKISK